MDPRDVTFLPPKIGTIDRKDANNFDYKAPHSIAHASLPVTILARAQVTHGAGFPVGYYEATQTLHVVRRKWAVKAEFKLDTGLCGGEKSYVFSYTDVQIQTFHLDDLDLELIADPPAAKASPDKVALTSCKCTATWQGEPKPITFTGAGGSLQFAGFNGLPTPAYFLLRGSAEVLIPGVDLTCFGEKLAVAPIPLTPFFLQLLMGVPGGLRPSDARPRFILLLQDLTIIMEWYSVAE